MIHSRLLLASLTALGCSSVSPQREPAANPSAPPPLILQERLRPDHPSSYVFSHPDGKARPGLVLLHGSSGGSLPHMWVHALQLASQGFNVMTLCWWDCEREDVRYGNPPFLAHIEIRKVINAMVWFKNSRFVGPSNKLGIFGISKGAELALILGPRQAEVAVTIDAIAVHAATDVAGPGINSGWNDRRCWNCDKKNCPKESWNPRCGPLNYGQEDPWNLPSWDWDGLPLKNKTVIPVERYRGPLLITHGDKDDVWSVEGVRRIESKMRAAGLNPEIHIFPEEGHGLNMPAEQRRRELVAEFFRRVLL